MDETTEIGVAEANTSTTETKPKLREGQTLKNAKKRIPGLVLGSQPSGEVTAGSGLIGAIKKQEGKETNPVPEYDPNAPADLTNAQDAVLAEDQAARADSNLKELWERHGTARYEKQKKIADQERTAAKKSIPPEGMLGPQELQERRKIHGTKYSGRGMPMPESTDVIRNRMEKAEKHYGTNPQGEGAPTLSKQKVQADLARMRAIPLREEDSTPVTSAPTGTDKPRIPTYEEMQQLEPRQEQPTQQLPFGIRLTDNLSQLFTGRHSKSYKEFMNDRIKSKYGSETKTPQLIQEDISKGKVVEDTVPQPSFKPVDTTKTMDERIHTGERLTDEQLKAKMQNLPPKVYGESPKKL